MAPRYVSSGLAGPLKKIEILNASPVVSLGMRFFVINPFCLLNLDSCFAEGIAYNIDKEEGFLTEGKMVIFLGEYERKYPCVQHIS